MMKTEGECVSRPANDDRGMDVFWAAFYNHEAALNTLCRKFDELSDKFNALGVTPIEAGQMTEKMPGIFPNVNPPSDQFLQINAKFRIILGSQRKIINHLLST